MRRTALHQLHVSLGAKMGEFAGYEMPLWYPGKIVEEHLHTRRFASLFDVSHMGQLVIGGPDPAQALERLMPSDLLGLERGRMRYCCLTNERGGIIDDLMASRSRSGMHLVVNAARKQRDIDHLERHAVSVEERNDRALLALQGPAAADALERLAPGARAQKFMTVRELDIDGAQCRVSRSGYTGEDGYEISVPGERAPDLAERLLAQADVKPAGLGARDSLRLEAGLRLYGQDMNEDTTPVEAGIGWTVSKSRRPAGERAGGFMGEERIFEQLAGGASRQIAGVRLEGSLPARAGALVTLPDGSEIGEVTSGGFAPSLNSPVAMARLRREHMVWGRDVAVVVRGKSRPAKLTQLPFVRHRYAS